MGSVYAEIELINGGDLALLRRNLIGEEEVKRMYVTALVDAGSYMMAINENVQAQLQFTVVETKKAQLADGSIIECNVVAPVEVHFKNRRTTCRAIVLPADSNIVLGAIQICDMDVLIHPLRQELIVNPDHPYFAQVKLK